MDLVALRKAAVNLITAIDTAQASLAGATSEMLAAIRPADVASEPDFAMPIRLRDSHGAALFVGDRARIIDSDRFGEVEGVVTGRLDDRVRLDLDLTTCTNLQDWQREDYIEAAEGYTSSTRRVTKLRGRTAAFAG